MHENLLTFEKLYSKEDLKLVFDYLDYLVDYYNSITVEEKKAIKGNYGAGGRLNIGELYKRN